VALRLRLAALGALLACGCEVYAVPSPLPCPGDLQGTFDFAAARIVQPTDCFFAQSGNPANQVTNPIGFPGVISFMPDGTGAALCKSVAHAVPNLGTRSGLTIDVASVEPLSVGGCTCPSADAVTAGNCSCPPNSPLSNCSCPVVQEQRIQGTLVPIPGGFSGFTGVLVYNLKPPGSVPSGTCDCQVACSYSYDLEATVVGAR
jgi:hypothetical protein